MLRRGRNLDSRSGYDGCRPWLLSTGPPRQGNAKTRVDERSTRDFAFYLGLAALGSVVVEIRDSSYAGFALCGAALCLSLSFFLSLSLSLFLSLALSLQQCMNLLQDLYLGIVVMIFTDGFTYVLLEHILQKSIYI